MAAGIEKRRGPRVEVSWPITILAETGTIEGEIRNVSVDGLLVFCEEPLRLNETYRMSILPGKHHAIGVSGRVVWADAYCMDEENTAFGVGICLVELTNEDREVLRSLMAGTSTSPPQKPQTDR
ncbi:MAG: PilZ domain-containing protein [Deltaproteobacteria bacterium]